MSKLSMRTMNGNAPCRDWEADMAQEKKMPIIGCKLQARLYRLGISQTQASREMGYSYSYLCVCFKRGWMPETAVQIIEDRYGISYKEYQKFRQRKK